MSWISVIYVYRDCGSRDLRFDFATIFPRFPHFSAPAMMTLPAWKDIEYIFILYISHFLPSLTLAAIHIPRQATMSMGLTRPQTIRLAIRPILARHMRAVQPG